jgi:hypothetical protein
VGAEQEAGRRGGIARPVCTSPAVDTYTHPAVRLLKSLPMHTMAEDNEKPMRGF